MRRRREAAREAPGRARAREPRDVDAPRRPVALGQLRQPSSELLDGVGVRALLRAVDARRVDERRRDVACDDDLDAAQVEVERLERAQAAVDRRRPADRDDHLPGSCVEGGPDQLAGAERRRAERVVPPLHEGEAARPRHLDDGRVAAHPPLRVDRRPERPGHTRHPPVSGRRAQHVERPLAAVREGKPGGRASRALDPRREGVCGFARGEAAAELVGTAEDGSLGPHVARISSAARSATITVGQFV